ncbi:MAG: hypothetical protein AAGD35_19815 [Actinomycetota bacterium]
MGEVLRDESTDRARTLARLVEPVHAVTYYSREMADLTDVGYKGWWHAYFGYRPAPLGPVGPGVVTATFYNFAPRMVERAVPGVWSIRSPEQALAIRLERVTAALQRIFGDGAHAESVTAAARLVRTAVDGAEVGGRPLFAAYAELDWPDDDLIALWHGCTLLREFRGESHNLALVADEVGPVASHVLMAGRGHGNRSTILAIRGFTDEEWDEAVDGLVGSGWAHPDGTLTEAGITARSRIEAHTDVLCSGPVAALGGAFDAFVDAMIPLVTHLSDTGEVSGRWPPDHLIKPE